MMTNEQRQLLVLAMLEAQLEASERGQPESARDEIDALVKMLPEEPNPVEPSPTI